MTLQNQNVREWLESLAQTQGQSKPTLPHWLSNKIQQAQPNASQPTSNPFRKPQPGTTAPQPNTPPAQPNRPPRPNPFGPQERVTVPVVPLGATVARFDLNGLGDPFYRLLGHPLNSDFGSVENVIATLEKGGDNVRELETLLEKAWTTYAFEGAALIYRWNQTAFKALMMPYPVPAEENTQQNQNNQDADDSGEETQPAALFNVVRAIDPALVLNVLARSRTQVLLAKAPLVFSPSYLLRGLYTDDSRLVALAKMTGAVQEMLS
ncbi:MAG: hypothetical protein SF029_06195 [bacterium]|nr:hypothetical protein [bacterium]